MLRRPVVRTLELGPCWERGFVGGRSAMLWTSCGPGQGRGIRQGRVSGHRIENKLRESCYQCNPSERLELDLEIRDKSITSRRSGN